MSRKRPVAMVSYRCLDCGNEFEAKGRSQLTHKCPRCKSQDLWGKCYESH